MRCCVLFVFFQSTTLLLLDDTESSETNALTIVIAEEKQLRMQLTAQMADVVSRLLTVESNQQKCGCQRRPTQHPAFMATLSADINSCGPRQAVVFDSIKLNNGNAYSKNHGMFTAPITGTYLFSATLSSEQGQSYQVAIVRGNSTNEIAYLFADGNTIWQERTTTVITHLDAYDEVWVLCLTNSHIEGDKMNSRVDSTDFYSHFSGVLMSAD